MKIAFLLLVHNQPAQAARLIETIAVEDCAVFVHVDARTNQEPFTEALANKNFKGTVHFTRNRLKGNWGGFSLVQASLNLLIEAVADKASFDYFVLLSGVDYPIKTVTHYKKFLQENTGKDFLEYFSLPSKRLNEKEGGLYRVNRYHYFVRNNHKEFPGYSKKPLLNSMFNSIAKFYYRYIRKMPLGMQVYAGSQWWTLQRSTVISLLDFLQKNKQVAKYFNNVWIPDELFYQTVLLHINEASLVNDNFRFIKWQEDNYNILRPVTLLEENFEEIKNSNAFFARKFDPIKSAALMNLIDDELLKT